MSENARHRKRTKNFMKKPRVVQELINDAFYILESLNVSLEKGMRQNEKTVMIFLALAGMKVGCPWSSSANVSNHALTTRDIIRNINSNYKETISSGSYDDIRRKGIASLIHAGIAEESMPWSAKNDSRRGYGISPDCSECIKCYNTPKWKKAIERMLKYKRKMEGVASRSSFSQNTIYVNKKMFNISPGIHNQMQKSVIEELLPRICKNAKILYFGDTAKKELVFEKNALYAMGMNVSSKSTLPDIIAHSTKKNTTYVIEVVHTSNPISNLRREKLANMCKRCKSNITYISVFKNKKMLQKFAANIGWETKVWLADSPEHMISFNGK